MFRIPQTQKNLGNSRILIVVISGLGDYRCCSFFRVLIYTFLNIYNKLMKYSVVFISFFNSVKNHKQSKMDFLRTHNYSTAPSGRSKICKRIRITKISEYFLFVTHLSQVEQHFSGLKGDLQSYPRLPTEVIIVKQNQVDDENPGG